MSSNPVLALSLFFSIVIIIYIYWAISRSSWFLNLLQSKRELIEDILKQLYHVEYSGKKASLNAMAGALKLSDRKLIKLVEEISSKGLIKVDNNQLNLTEAGRDYALKIIRVHRIWEKYLSEKTGFDKSEWHDRAEHKEHQLDQAQTDKLYSDLGNPRFDPHGDPIPTASGEIIKTSWSPLSGLPIGAEARIVHLEDEPEVIYNQLLKSGLHMGSQVKVIESSDQEVRFFCEGEEYRFSPIVASNISVTELTAQEQFEKDMVRLSALNQGERATILGISSESRGASRRRLLDLGFIKGTTIETEFENPLKEPRAYSIRNTVVALRNDQADLILIKKENE